MPQLLHVSASFFAGDPAASGADSSQSGWVERIARRRSYLAVKCHAGFQRDQRQSSKDEASKSFIQLASFGFEQAGFNGDSSCAQRFKAFSRDFGIGVCHGRHNTFDTRSNQRIRAGGRAALMALRLKIEIDGAAVCVRSSLLKRQNLCVLQPVKCVEAFANELSSAIYYYCTDASAGRRKSTAAEREIQRPPHEVFV